jgi:flagellar biogenesis protein FliO
LPAHGAGWGVPLLLQQAAPSLAPSSFALDLARTLLALLAVCALLFASLRFLSRRGLIGAAGGGVLRVVQRLPLESRKTLYLVAAGERLLIIATGDGGAPRLIAELGAGDVAAGDAKGAGDAKAVAYASVGTGETRDV